MRRYITPIVAGIMAVVAAPAVAVAQETVVTVDLNMRAGPSTAFPVVDVLEESTPVDVHGCLSGYSWCDVSTDANRGWVSGAYLTYAVRGSYVPLFQYVSEMDVPIIGFTVGSYWDSYYRNRPWYSERAQWGDRWQSNWRDIRHEGVRVDRRIYGRQDRFARRVNRAERRIEGGERWDRLRVNRRPDSRDGRFERLRDDRVERRERVQERRVNRVERRSPRNDRMERSQGQAQPIQRPERVGPRPRDRGDRMDRGHRRGRDG